MKFIAGPCVIESAELLDTVAERLVAINRRLGTQIIFKASFDKANRTSIASFRGPGLEQGLQMLADVRAKWGLKAPDGHPRVVAGGACRRGGRCDPDSGLSVPPDRPAAGRGEDRLHGEHQEGAVPFGSRHAIPLRKGFCEAGAREVWLTERGNSFGYNNLVVDFRNIPDMLKIAPTVIMDCTHSVQRPGAAGGKTGGNREFVPAMALAAKAFGANGYFFEVHPDPDRGLSDAANMLRLNDLEPLIESLLQVK